MNRLKKEVGSDSKSHYATIVPTEAQGKKPHQTRIWIKVLVSCIMTFWRPSRQLVDDGDDNDDETRLNKCFFFQYSPLVVRSLSTPRRNAVIMSQRPVALWTINGCLWMTPVIRQVNLRKTPNWLQFLARCFLSVISPRVSRSSQKRNFLSFSLHGSCAFQIPRACVVCGVHFLLLRTARQEMFLTKIQSLSREHIKKCSLCKYQWTDKTDFRSLHIKSLYCK